MNPDRLILGLAVPFDETSLDGELHFQARHFARFAELETALPLWFSHQGSIITARGVVPDYGRARFAMLPAGYDAIPPGLLALGEIDPTPMGDGLLDEIRQGLLDPWSERSLTGLSLGMNLLYAEGTDDLEMVWPTELSICYRPRFEAGRILAVGQAASRSWERLIADIDVRTGRQA